MKNKTAVVGSKHLLGLVSAILVIAAHAATAAETVLFEDQHVRFVEVTQWPGEKAATSSRTIPSMIASDASWPDLTVEGKTIGGTARGYPTGGKLYPWCQTLGDQEAGSVTVKGDFPLHYYRMEYKRIDGDGYAANWKTWYADLMKNIPKFQGPAPTMQSGPEVSPEWPFPIQYDAALAAPANHYVRYEDNHIQLVEVFIRPGETELMHGHPLSSVYFDDGGGFYPNIETHSENLRANPPSFKGVGLAAPADKYPTCYAANPQWVHATTAIGALPQHFYRLQFRRLDGEDIKTHGSEWYPKQSITKAVALTPDQQQLEALEKQRLAAIAKGDAQVLAAVLADDYMHIHGSARVEDKTAFIKTIIERPRETTRGPLTIRVYGDTAVITGEQVNTSIAADKTVTSTTYMATQVARRIQGRWQLVSMQVTPKTAN
jgi:hypothetical protein